MKWLGAFFACVALAGCGVGSTTVIEKTVTTEIPEQKSQTQVESETAPVEVPPTRKPAVHHESIEPWSFRMPSGNIFCSMVPTAVRCEIKDRSWAPPPRPTSCQNDWGDQVDVIENQPAEFTCFTGPAADNLDAPRLHYGEILRRAPMVCVSLPKGLTCGNRRTRHAFFLSFEKFWIK